MANIKTLLERCIETTKITPEDEFNSLPDKDLLATKIKDLNLYDENHIKNDKKIEYLNLVSNEDSEDEQESCVSNNNIPINKQEFSSLPV